MEFLSKSDFQLASSCAKKLIYKKAYYPTSNDTNEYMEMLAQGGYIIGRIATLIYPEGIEISGNREESLSQTAELMKKENIVLFEAAILAGQKLVRIDILVKEGMSLHLIEVKAKSYDSTDPRAKSSLGKHIEDVAYQFLVLKEAFPDYEIRCSLFLPDKSTRTQIESLGGWFSFEKETHETDNEIDDVITRQKPGFQKPRIIFKYENDTDRGRFIEQLQEDGILTLLDVTKEVISMQPAIKQRALTFLRILNEGITSDDFSIGKGCKGCEFNTPTNEMNGFVECWGSLAYRPHHIFDLYFGGAIGSRTNGFYLDELIGNGKTDLFDVDIERLKKSNGELGSRAERQILQLNNTRAETEWISEELASKLNEFNYPLHFVDFETYTGAVPFHKNMRPYELIAFQWSCHTIKSRGEEPEHKEWIHTGTMFPDHAEFPNFEFALSLMQHIGDSGTPFMWATHENTVLRTILNQMEEFGYINEELSLWLNRMTSDKGREGRWVDMNKMTLQYYFHPHMKGKSSIKKVLPAVWSNFPDLHKVSHFNGYAPDKLYEGIIDPYDTLTAGIGFGEMEDDVVSGGTDAMRAYQRLRFDDSLSEEKKNEVRRQLLEYCKLDTMAMVIIAHHWGLK